MSGDNPYQPPTQTDSFGPSTSATPSWLQEEPSQAQSTSNASSMHMASSSSSTASSSSFNRANIKSSDEIVVPEKLKKYMFWMRIANIAVTISVCINAVFVVLSQPSIASAFLAIYVFCFSSIICCFEVGLARISLAIAENLGFMYNAKGRIVFFFLIAVLCFSLSLGGIIVGILVVLLLCFNAYVMILFPEYEVLQRLRHKEGADDPRNAKPMVVATVGQYTATTSYTTQQQTNTSSGGYDGRGIV